MADIRKRQGKKGVTYQVRYPNASTKAGYSFKTFRTMKEARAFSESSSEWDDNPSDDFTTVDDAIDLWLKACEKEGLNGSDPVTQYTLENYKYRSNIIKKYEWRDSLQRLSSPDVVNFRSWLLTNGYSRDLARKVLFTLQSVMKEMKQRGLITNNIASGIGIKNNSRYKEQVSIPNKAEISSLLMAADRLAASENKQIARTWKRYRPILYLAVDSGMRPQEYLAVSKSNLTDQGIQVERAIDGSGKMLSVTKTPAGKRFIELNSKTIKIIRDYMDSQEIRGEYDLIFPNLKGGLQCRKNWQRRGFNVACKEAGLVERSLVKGKIKLIPKFRPYDLRHFYASVLIQNIQKKNISLKKIQYLMGHEKIETTLNVYGHLLDDDLNVKAKSYGILEDLS